MRRFEDRTDPATGRAPRRSSARKRSSGASERWSGSPSTARTVRP